MAAMRSDRETSFTPTEADYIAANRAWLLHYLTGRQMRWLGALVAALLLIGTAAHAIDGDWQLLAYIAAGTMLFAGIQLLHWLLVPKRVRRTLLQRPATLTRTRFVWDEEGLEAESDAGVSRLRWRELYRWFEGTHGFVFLLSDYMLLVLPAHALTAAQSEDLRSLLLGREAHPNGAAR